MRGVYENPIGSGIWWVHYYGAGKRHREKVGRKSDAIKLYQSRKADVAAGRKLPELRNSKVVTLSELIDDVLEFVAHHKDNRSYTSKGEIVREALGSGLLQTSLRRNWNAGLEPAAKRLLLRTVIKRSSHFAIARAFAMEKCP
jgi:hypothetical protein